VKYKTTATAWIAGMRQVPHHTWQEMTKAAAGRGGLFTAEKAELFMRRNFSEFDRATGAWRDVHFGDFDLGHIKARATNPQYAHQVKNHVYETASSNRAHGAADMPKAYWKEMGKVVGRAKFRARVGRVAKAGGKAGVWAAVTELPFAAAESYLDWRDCKRSKAQAAGDCAKKTGIAGAVGAVVGSAAFCVGGAIGGTTATVIAFPLLAVGLYGQGARAKQIYDRFITPPWKNLWQPAPQLATARNPAQFAPSTFTTTVIRSISSPSSASGTTRCAKSKP